MGFNHAYHFVLWRIEHVGTWHHWHIPRKAFYSKQVKAALHRKKLKLVKQKILLSFDVEEFDMPIEYGRQISVAEQMAVGMEGLDAISPILSEDGIVATLFTTAYFAEYFPAQIFELSEKHEIASHTFYHSNFETKHLSESKKRLEELTGKKITGIRMPRMKAVNSDSVLFAGYDYDASIHPTWLPGRYNNLSLSRTPYFDKQLLRIPASVTPAYRIPLFWLSFKNFPFEVYKRLALKTLKNDGLLSLYFHPWEFANISKYGLPNYTKRICGNALVERLQKLLACLKQEGEFLTMDNYSKIISSAATPSYSRDLNRSVLVE